MIVLAWADLIELFIIVLMNVPQLPDRATQPGGVGCEARKLPISLSDNPQLKSVAASQVFCQSPCKLDQLFSLTPDTPNPGTFKSFLCYTQNSKKPEKHISSVHTRYSKFIFSRLKRFISSKSLLDVFF